MRKYILSCIGAVCLIASCLGYVFAWSPQVVMAARVINGFGFALCSISLSTWFSLLLPKEHMGAGMGVYGTMNALAMALAPAIGIYCYHHLGYRAAFCVATAFAAAIIVLIQFVSYKNEPLPPAGKGFLPDQFVDTGVLPVSFLIMVFTIPYCATQSFLVQYVQAKGLPFSAGMFFPAYAVALLLLRTAMRDLFDRLSFQFFFLMACLCTAGSILLLAVMDSFWEMIAAAVLMAGSYGVMCSVCQALAIVVAVGGKRGVGEQHLLYRHRFRHGLRALVRRPAVRRAADFLLLSRSPDVAAGGSGHLLVWPAARIFRPVFCSYKVKPLTFER